MQTNRFYSHGKLLLSAEYFVLDGALALALPTKKGQSLQVTTLETEKKIIDYKAFLENDSLWFSCQIETSNWQISQSSNLDLSKTFLQLLKCIQALNPIIFYKSYQMDSQLEFNKNWGLGSSSTLVNNLANWANINPYQLLQKSFGGSGYDLACAQASSAILYQKNANEPKIQAVEFNPPFKENLWFVYLNQKQNSREGIALYKNKKHNQNLITAVSRISKQMLTTKNLTEFQQLMQQHERLVANYLGLDMVQDLFFKDFTLGNIKSLGAWGGDFVLVAAKENPTSYFLEKGFATILRFDEMILA